MQQISEDLPTVLDKLDVKLVIGLGEGAGANILARFGMAAPTRCMGLILIHCTASTASVMEHFKDKVSNAPPPLQMLLVLQIISIEG